MTDLSVLRQSAAELREAFPDPWIRQFSVKANDVPAIIAEVASCGFGANVVSAGEWALATEAGLSNERITLEGIGKTDHDLTAAVRALADGAPLRWVAIESVEEAAALARLAGDGRVASAGRKLDVLLRLNPAVEPETSPGLAVGSGSSKFGLKASELAQAIDAGGRASGPLHWHGVHLHIGSQLRAVAAWTAAVGSALEVFAQWKRSLPDFTVLDIGGGFPVASESVPRPADFAAAFRDALQMIPSEHRPAQLAIEPGRFLTARAGYIVACVLHVRSGRTHGGEPLVVIDAGMTEIIRPALYGARHQIIALNHAAPDAKAEPVAKTRVEGPICESTDRLGAHDLPPLKRGDLVAILDAGAYASSMSSRYNGRPRAAEVLLERNGQLRLARPASAGR